MSEVFFTSDTHFRHRNIIKHCARPFASVEEMDAVLVKRWNDVVKDEDVVYHLGDFAFGNATEEDVMDIGMRLNGSVRFIEGNHDRVTLSAYRNGMLPRWTLLTPYFESTFGVQRIVMCHYAMRTWHHDLRGSWMLYGHSHNELPPLGKSCDVGVDAWDFTPVHIDQLAAFMADRPIHDAPAFKQYNPGEANL